MLQCENPVEKHKEPDHGRREQHPRVPAEPSEVQTDLLAKIPPETTAEEVKKYDGALGPQQIR